MGKKCCPNNKKRNIIIVNEITNLLTPVCLFINLYVLTRFRGRIRSLKRIIQPSILSTANHCELYSLIKFVTFECNILPFSSISITQESIREVGSAWLHSIRFVIITFKKIQRFTRCKVDVFFWNDFFWLCPVLLLPENGFVWSIRRIKLEREAIFWGKIEKKRAKEVVVVAVFLCWCLLLLFVFALFLFVSLHRSL